MTRNQALERIKTNGLPVILAAAGRSRRYGRPKLLEPVPGTDKLLIQHVMEQRTLALTDWITILDPTTEEWVERWGWKLPARILPLSSTHGEFEALLHALANEPQPWSNLRPVAVDEHMPLVSICITHFNRLALLRQAIDSIGYSIVRC